MATAATPGSSATGNVDWRRQEWHEFDGATLPQCRRTEPRSQNPPLAPFSPQSSGKNSRTASRIPLTSICQK